MKNGISHLDSQNIIQKQQIQYVATLRSRIFPQVLKQIPVFLQDYYLIWCPDPLKLLLQGVAAIAGGRV